MGLTDQELMITAGLFVCSICAVGIISAFQLLKKALNDDVKQADK